MYRSGRTEMNNHSGGALGVWLVKRGYNCTQCVSVLSRINDELPNVCTHVPAPLSRTITRLISPPMPNVIGLRAI